MNRKQMIIKIADFLDLNDKQEEADFMDQMLKDDVDDFEIQIPQEELDEINKIYKLLGESLRN